MRNPRRVPRILAQALVLCASLLPLAAHPQKAPKPLSKDDVIRLLKGDVPPTRVAEIARERGVDFELTPTVESDLRQVGADDSLLAALRELAPRPAEIVVQTSPGAEVYLDDRFSGRASPEGRLVISDVKAGAHKIRVSLTAKKDCSQDVTAVAGRTLTLEANLTALGGTVLVRSSPGAEVYLDGKRRGAAGSNGELVVEDVPAGDRQVRVTAPGKRAFEQQVSVVAGERAVMEAKLADLLAPGMARDNPKDALKYVYIPPGTFSMGCSPGDSECSGNEKPAHQVTMSKGFWLGKTEVTVGAYKRFVASTRGHMPGPPSFNSGWENDNMPIVNVIWDDAQAYCTWAGGRLPTEAEWEYAARAGSTEARYGPLNEIAWHKQNSRGQAHDVAQKRANGWGLFDMLGNVWEWGYDRWRAGKVRVVRGGSWANDARFNRVSERFGVVFPLGRVHMDHVGFRCAREVSSP